MLNFREGDIIGRLGGDEFAILMTQTPVAAAQNAMERFQQDIAERSLEIQASESISISASALPPSAMKSANGANFTERRTPRSTKPKTAGETAFAFLRET